MIISHVKSTVLSQICDTMELLDNDVSSDDSETVDRGAKYCRSSDHHRFRGGLLLRWLSDVFVRQLLGMPEVGVPNKVVIFAPLLGQASYANWFLRIFNASIHSILYHTGVARETGIGYYKGLLRLIDLQHRFSRQPSVAPGWT